MYLTITNLGHCGHMTWYIWNILDNIPSQDVLVTSVWYILNALNICWFGTVLVLRPRPYNVLAMYQVSTSPLTPSVCIWKSEQTVQPTHQNLHEELECTQREAQTTVFCPLLFNIAWCKLQRAISSIPRELVGGTLNHSPQWTDTSSQWPWKIHTGVWLSTWARDIVPHLPAPFARWQPTTSGVGIRNRGQREPELYPG